MSKLRLITAFLFAIFMVLGVTAQVHTQKGIVRKVTRSASDPFIPVQGVQVIVSGEANKASDKDGRFSLKVKVTDKAGSYTLTAVRVPQGSKYMLASPSKGKRLFISANDLEVSLITPEEKEMEYKKRYELLKEKYEEQSLSLRKLRNELNKRLGELSESDVHYARLKAECDSIRKLYLDYINNEDKIDEVIKELAGELALTKATKYKNAVLDGLEYLLKTQKKNGGWRGWDVDAITFNDEVTTGVLRLFLHINEGDLNFSWLDDTMRKRICQAFNKGIDMILRAQYVQNGVKTVWGQQHDNNTLLPTNARTFELASLTAGESCDVVRLLMEIPHPSDEVVESVKAAMAWFERVAITGMRVEKVAIPEDKAANHEYPYDLVVVKDKKAPRIWSRFYEMSDNTPFMCNRDGIKVYKLSDVKLERRVGYAWYTYAPEKLFKLYKEWLKKVEAEKAYTGYEVQNDMPLFYEQLKKSLTYPMAWGNAPEKDFGKWREQAREKLLECIQPAPPVAPYDMKVIATEKRKGYEAQKIVFNVSEYSRVPAYLLVPEGKGPFPAVLLLHDHGAHFTIGKEKMVRPFGVSEIVMKDADNWAVGCYDGQYVGDYLAENGYVVLALDALFWGERGRKEYARYDSQQALSANLLQMGMSWGGLIAWDDIRSAEFLASLPQVDKEKVATMGFSMGAHRAWMTMAATDAVKAGAAVCWMNTTDSLMTMTNNQNKGGSAYAMLVPNIRRYMDYPHVASIACPKPMLFTNGKKDKLFPVEGVEAAYDTMRKVWDSQGAGEHLQNKLYDLPHFCSKEIQKAILDFFNKELNVKQK